MRITSKGQVTIPILLRERVGMLPATEVEFVQDGEDLRLIRSRPSKSAAISRGEAIVRRLEGSSTSGYSTDEIMRMTRGDD